MHSIPTSNTLHVMSYIYHLQLELEKKKEAGYLFYNFAENCFNEKKEILVSRFMD